MAAELSIEAYQADAAPEFYQVYTASFATRTAQLWDFVTWHYQVAEGDFHPELSYLMRHRGAPVGYLMSQDADEPGSIFVQHLGVVPAYRRQGLAAGPAVLHRGARERCWALGFDLDRGIRQRSGASRLCQTGIQARFLPVRVSQGVALSPDGVRNKVTPGPSATTSVAIQSQPRRM